MKEQKGRPCILAVFQVELSQHPFTESCKQVPVSSWEKCQLLLNLSQLRIRLKRVLWSYWNLSAPVQA